MPIIVFFILHEGMFEKFVDVILDKQGVSKNAHGLNNRAVDLIIMFNDTNETLVRKVYKNKPIVCFCIVRRK